MNQLNLFWGYLNRIPVFTANGFLFLGYAFLDHLGLWVVVGCGLLFALVFDCASVRLISAAPSRIGSRLAPQVETGLGVRVLTLVTVGVCCGAGMVYAEPIPTILAGMWFSAVMVLVLLPAEREPILWRVKGTLLLYALVLLGFKFYLAQAQTASPEDWASTIGSVGTARDALVRTRDLFTTIGLWATWFIVPFAHFSYLVQRVLVNSPSLFFAQKNVQDILIAMRRRQ
ncbi:MAG: hypothetical protein HZB51_15385 [Chloroflexi bacterium]|nr:hypothetical protein [Chloroflexota bacterium]